MYDYNLNKVNKICQEYKKAKANIDNNLFTINDLRIKNKFVNQSNKLSRRNRHLLYVLFIKENGYRLETREHYILKKKIAYRFLEANEL